MGRYLTFVTFWLWFCAGGMLSLQGGDGLNRQKAHVPILPAGVCQIFNLQKSSPKNVNSVITSYLCADGKSGEVS